MKRIGLQRSFRALRSSSYPKAKETAVRLTPKAKIYDKIALDFNAQFDYVLIDARQIKNKIAKMRTQFKLANAKRNELGFGSTDEEQWKKLIMDICPFYFELEESWPTSWGNAPTQYIDSLSNLDDPFIAEDDGEPGEWIDVAEGGVEQPEAEEEEEEEESLIRCSRVQPPGKTTQRQHTSKPAAYRKRPRQLEQLEQLEQEQEELQELLPSTSKKLKKSKEAVQKSGRKH
ncbi:hypothetical protein BG011_000384 [Mortierella polycephala]|uniref:Uncharacterized protein n=1 Tax=Mortierella polycephala TaxID=41804 RepID=A0A9P6PLQ3_9FUNG|nr:hypothetical protein BG011_000384 [Mortierella polycephala]